MDAPEQSVFFAENGDVARISRLLEHGAAVDARNTQGCTALGAAAGRGRADVVRVLVGAGAERGQRAGHYFKCTPLTFAALTPAARTRAAPRRQPVRRVGAVWEQPVHQVLVPSVLRGRRQYQRYEP